MSEELSLRQRIVRMLRKVVPLVLVFAVGLGVLPAYGLAQDVIHDIKLGQLIAEDIDYQFALAVEAQFPDLVVVKSSVGEDFIVADVFIGNLQALRGWKFARLLSDVFDLMVEYYPDKAVYVLMTVEPRLIPAIDGNAWAIYEMDLHAISAEDLPALRELADRYQFATTEEEIKAVIEGLYVTIMLDFARQYGGVPLVGGFFDRFTDYVYPWEDGYEAPTVPQ